MWPKAHATTADMSGLWESSPSHARTHRDYEIGWVCAIPLEYTAAQLLLDDRHEPLEQDPNDDNDYVLGNIGKFNVVIACPRAGGMGMNTAAVISTDMRRTYTSLQLQLLVGIAGGVPTTKDDIRLGDVVVGIRIVQHDLSKLKQGQVVESIAGISQPPPEVTTAVARLQDMHNTQGSQIDRWLEHIVCEEPGKRRFASSHDLEDHLFESTYTCTTSGNTCRDCDQTKHIQRHQRVFPGVSIHYGTIATGNQVIRDARVRDELSRKHGVLCVEMEGAALQAVNVPFLVIRGICDYADSHKNKDWQPYAATVAAAVAKEFLSVFTPTTRGRYFITSFHCFLLGPEEPEIDVLEAVTSSTQHVWKHEPSSQYTQQAVKEHVESDNDTYKTLLESLYFEQIDARQMNIHDAHFETCTWLPLTQEFSDWLDESKAKDHHRLLWIKGNPGTGKSTIMKFLFDHLRQEKKEHRTVVSFFFHGRGHPIEKSVQDMFRSLLWQLLTKLPGLYGLLEQHLIFEMHRNSMQWKLATLERVFTSIVGKLGKHHLTCLIDALDECDPDDIRKMVSFLEKCTVHASESGIQFFLCFASRHYPHITVRKGTELHLDKQRGHAKDIAIYIKRNLNVGCSDTDNTLRNQIEQRASGVFLWVVLVVQELNNQYDSGAGLNYLQETLRRIPDDLKTLFRGIIQPDGDMGHETRLCLQLVLSARRPLTLPELYFAVHAGMPTNRDAAIMDWNHEDIPLDAMARFILQASKGLAEVEGMNLAIASKVLAEVEGREIDEQTKVQFIHESVKDFLLDANATNGIWAHLVGNFEASCHDQFIELCSRYIRIRHRMVDPANLVWPKDDRRVTLGNHPRRNDVERAFPFMNYAVHNIFWHADRAQSLGIAQDAFVKNFPITYERWVHLRPVFERSYDRKGRPHDISFLYFCAEEGLADLIYASPSLHDCIKVGSGDFRFPLLAAAMKGNQAVLHEFLEFLKSSEVPSGKIVTEEESRPQISDNGHCCLKSEGGESVLGYLARYGDDDIFSTVLRYMGSQNASRDLVFFFSSFELHQQQFGRPIGVSQEAIVRKILQRPRVYDNKQSPLMYQAVKAGQPWAINVLFQHGAQLESGNLKGETPLIAAAKEGYAGTVDLLLSLGAAIEARNCRGQTSLIVAAANHHERVVKFLLSKGASIRARDTFGRTALVSAAASSKEVTAKRKHSFERTMQRLLDYGAELDSIDGLGRTPLSCAAAEAGSNVYGIEWLIDRGATVTDQDTRFGLSALHWAAIYDNEHASRTLLHRGASIEARDLDDRTPLWYAARWGSLRVIVALLDSQAVPHARNTSGMTPLHIVAAQTPGDMAPKVILLFLERGAKADWQDYKGRSALHYAALDLPRFNLPEDEEIERLWGQKRQYIREALGDFLDLVINVPDLQQVVDNGFPVQQKADKWPQGVSRRLGGVISSLLGQNGADVDCRDERGATPLMLAAGNGVEETVGVLLELGALVDIEDVNHRRAIDWAAGEHHTNIVRQLEALSQNPRNIPNEELEVFENFDDLGDSDNQEDLDYLEHLADSESSEDDDMTGGGVTLIRSR